MQQCLQVITSHIWAPRPLRVESFCSFSISKSLYTRWNIEETRWKSTLRSYFFHDAMCPVAVHQKVRRDYPLEGDSSMSFWEEGLFSISGSWLGLDWGMCSKLLPVALPLRLMFNWVVQSSTDRWPNFTWNHGGATGERKRFLQLGLCCSTSTRQICNMGDISASCTARDGKSWDPAIVVPLFECVECVLKR